jgi:hypothetical protein
MRVTRGHLLLAFGLLAGAAGLAVIIAPEILPPEVDQLNDILDGQTVSRFAVGLAFFVVLVAFFRLLKSSPEQVDRSPIAGTPPELVTADEAENADRQARLAYDRALKRFESPDHSVRLVAIYGRRAQSATEMDSQLERYLQELAGTAADTYAMAVGCDEATAKRAVETGRWTEDRVAAAFLATDLDSERSFTAWERFNAWLAPERAFERRVRRVLEEIEWYAGSYLTYEGIADGSPRTREQTDSTGDQPPSSGSPTERGVTNARADGGVEGTRPGEETAVKPEGRHVE